MQGIVCLVTGGNGVIGQATAVGLAQHGADVILACRSRERGEAAKAAVNAAADGAKSGAHVELLMVDLSVQQSIRQAAAEFLANHARLDVLINNAAVFKAKRTVTPDGLETMFATNHLGVFLLTMLLLDTLKGSGFARILTMTAPSTTTLNFDDLQGEQHFGALDAFGASKMCNLLFTYALSVQLEGTGVTAIAIHPGIVKSGLMKEAALPMRLLRRLSRRHRASFIWHLRRKWRVSPGCSSRVNSRLSQMPIRMIQRCRIICGKPVPR